MKSYTICFAVLCLLLAVQVSLAKKKGNPLVILTEKNFKAKTSSGYVFIKFWSPACGFCTEMAPQWDELATLFAGHASVKIAKIDCSVHKKRCETENVYGFPGLWWYKDGYQKKEFIDARTVQAFKKFVTDNLPRDEL